MRRELDSLADRVHYPAEDELSSGPAPVALKQLLEGHCFVAVRFVRGRACEDLVNGMEEVRAQGLEAPWAALP